MVKNITDSVILFKEWRSSFSKSDARCTIRGATGFRGIRVRCLVLLLLCVNPTNHLNHPRPSAASFSQNSKFAWKLLMFFAFTYNFFVFLIFLFDLSRVICEYCHSVQNLYLKKGQAS